MQTERPTRLKTSTCAMSDKAYDEGLGKASSDAANGNGAGISRMTGIDEGLRAGMHRSGDAGCVHRALNPHPDGTEERRRFATIEHAMQTGFPVSGAMQKMVICE